MGPFHQRLFITVSSFESYLDMTGTVVEPNLTRTLNVYGM